MLFRDPLSSIMRSISLVSASAVSWAQCSHSAIGGRFYASLFCTCTKRTSPKTRNTPFEGYFWTCKAGFRDGITYLHFFDPCVSLCVELFLISTHRAFGCHADHRFLVLSELRHPGGGPDQQKTTKPAFLHVQPTQCTHHWLYACGAASARANQLACRIRTTRLAQGESRPVAHNVHLRLQSFGRLLHCLLRDSSCIIGGQRDR